MRKTTITARMHGDGKLMKRQPNGEEEVLHGYAGRADE